MKYIDLDINSCALGCKYRDIWNRTGPLFFIVWSRCGRVFSLKFLWPVLFYKFIGQFLLNHRRVKYFKYNISNPFKQSQNYSNEECLRMCKPISHLFNGEMIHGLCAMLNLMQGIRGSWRPPSPLATYKAPCA